MEAGGIRIMAPITIAVMPAVAIFAVVCLVGLLAATIWIALKKGRY
ncbi:MAG: hypothetical protein Q8L68_04840 [Methylococcales bacterium]|nr:hypothetical protein [Methylococcales bacterium]